MRIDGWIYIVCESHGWEDFKGEGAGRMGSDEGLQRVGDGTAMRQRFEGFLWSGGVG